MGRPIVTSDQLWTRMYVISVGKLSNVFCDALGIEPSSWTLPNAGDRDHPISVLFAILPEGNEHAGMRSMWMNCTFDADPASIIRVVFNTIEDLPMIVEDKQWRSDDRALLKLCLEQGLKQAMFSERISE